MIARRLLVLALAVAACNRGAAPGPRVGVSEAPAEGPALPTEPKPDEQKEPPEDVVERSAMPISGIRLSDAAELSESQLFDELSRFDAVCIGEQHDNPHHHYAKLALVEGLARRAAHRGEALGIGFEMFQAPFQPALDSYAKGALSEEQLITASEYSERWGFPFAYYRPLLELGRSQGLALLALNARRELTRSAARHGLENLSAELERELPELDLSDDTHRQAFDSMMEGHPKGHGSPDRLYVAQVIWDETMAERAADYLSRGRPAAKLVIAAGLAHCSRRAIPARVERRLAARVASVAPSIGAPKEPPPGFDYALVMTPPAE